MGGVNTCRKQGVVPCIKSAVKQEDLPFPAFRANAAEVPIHNDEHILGM